MRAQQTTNQEVTGGAGTTQSAESARDPDRDRQPVDVDHALPPISQGIAIIAALLGALLTTLYASLAVPFGIAGVALVAGALFITRSRRWLSVGSVLVLVGAIVTGAYGAVSPELMLVGIGATILAWDVGQHGIVIGEQLGRRTRTTRNLLVHATSSAVVIGLVSGVAYLGYLVARDGRHASAVVLVLLGVITMAWIFRS
jgi:hypothetical protein